MCSSFSACCGRARFTRNNERPLIRLLLYSWSAEKGMKFLKYLALKAAHPAAKHSTHPATKTGLARHARLRAVNVQKTKRRRFAWHFLTPQLTSAASWAVRPMRTAETTQSAIQRVVVRPVSRLFAQTERRSISEPTSYINYPICLIRPRPAPPKVPATMQSARLVHRPKSRLSGFPLRPLSPCSARDCCDSSE